MKGIVFNVLEHVVVEEHGEDTWDALLDRTGLDGAYTSLANYPDQDLLRLVGAASSMLEIDPQHVISWFGRRALPVFAGRYPELFAAHGDARAFMLTLNQVIHPEVRKLLPGAIVPDFDFDASDPHELRMAYQSPRMLCSFAEGLITGAADHYGQGVDIRQPECMHRGDDRCLLAIRFSQDA
jgi:hypothetical protein